jgi:hypothetical protein
MFPIIPQLRDLLDAVKPEFDFIFTGSRGAAIDLENLADCVMKPAMAAHGLQVARLACIPPWQDRAATGHGCDAAIRGQNRMCDRCATARVAELAQP